ncbi:iron-sulfur cluster insertion protein ErpA [Candidatus Endowatersipora endosymbiont of Watersipora subatra]|uniref:iron-sulfur cluster insertion protein ErpA n=1 Tax=Candidatus Endowatersipora endosymbiont of Watersipora subatra TaxID=3077946 RepID=UPI00312C9D16
MKNLKNRVTLSNSAAKRISEILSSQNEKTALRISVEGGGCSGFSYKFNLVENPADDDFIIDQSDSIIVIDSISLMYMDGSEIDFIDNLMGQRFQINNPKATKNCGCGTSFSL